MLVAGSSGFAARIASASSRVPDVWPVSRGTDAALRNASSALTLLPHLPKTFGRRPKRAPALPHVRPEIARCLDALRHVPQREALRRHLPTFDLFPRAGSGHGSARFRTDRVWRRKRRAVAVSAGVDENPSAAVRLAELLRQVIGIARHEHGADGVRESCHF